MSSMENFTITVNSDGTTSIASRPSGVPVSGDAIAIGEGKDNTKLQDRAKEVLLADATAVEEALSWLGLSEAESARLNGYRIHTLVNRLYPGGTSAFLAGGYETDRQLAA